MRKTRGASRQQAGTGRAGQGSGASSCSSCAGGERQDERRSEADRDASASRRVGASMRASAAGCDIATAGSAGDVGNAEHPPGERNRAQSTGAAAGSKPAAEAAPRACDTARGATAQETSETTDLC